LLTQIRIARGVVAQRFGPGAKAGDDMLGSFIRHGLTAEEARSEIVVQLYAPVPKFKLAQTDEKHSMAGSDTTSIAIRIIVLYLITTPRVLSKFRAEYSKASISSPITDAEARNLPYLQAIINGQFVPAGTKVGTAVFGMMRNKKLFGEDVDIFRPERWLDASPEKIKEREQVVDLVFGTGRFRCLGSSIALIELNKIFVEVSVDVV
jgi:hypothetical protein